MLNNLTASLSSAFHLHAAGFADRRCGIAGCSTHPARDSRSRSGLILPNHHPCPETLMSYAAGTLPGTMAYVVWQHLSVCDECTRQVRRLEMVGGILLGNLEASHSAHRPAAFRNGFSAREIGKPGSSSMAALESALLPQGLARYLDPRAASLSWTQVERGQWEHFDDRGFFRLSQLAPGQYLSDCGSSSETNLTLVLGGALGDDGEIFGAGDFIEWGDYPSRRLLVLGDKDSICLSAGAMPRG